MHDIALKKIKDYLKKNECVIYQVPHGYNKGNVQKICPSITISSWENNNFLVERKDKKCLKK